MTTTPLRHHARATPCSGIGWTWTVAAVAILATVIAFRRFASNERVANAVAFGVQRRRGDSVDPATLNLNRA